MLRSHDYPPLCMLCYALAARDSRHRELPVGQESVQTAEDKGANSVAKRGGSGANDGRDLQQIPAELKRFMTAKAHAIALENEDVLFVPNSASKSAEAWNRLCRLVWPSVDRRTNANF